MCNGCLNATCQCKSQRLPKVGETWGDKHRTDERFVEAVTDRFVYYTLGGVPYGAKIKDFIVSNNPPKPKPREWLTALDTDGSSASVLYPLDSPLTRYKGVYQIIKVREVLD